MSLYELKKMQKDLGGNADMYQELLDQGWESREEQDGIDIYWKHLKDDPKAITSLYDLQKEIYKINCEHGFWEDALPNVPEKIALMHSELSEALEHIRDFREFNEVWIRNMDDGKKPEGFAIELADCVIRIFDFCGWAGINLEQAIAIKLKYNRGRKYKHQKSC